jgi:hypothetical protein
MKSFKKVIAGVCSLIMFSTVATCVVSADLDENIGTSLGASKDSTVGKSGDDEDTDPTVGKSGDEAQDPTVGDSGDKDDDDTTGGGSGSAGNDSNSSVEHTPTYVVGTSKLVGDVNNDDDVNAMDLVLMKKYVLQITDTIDEDVADINNDGSVRVDDLLLLKKYVLNIIGSFDAYRA